MRSVLGLGGGGAAISAAVVRGMESGCSVAAAR